MKIKIISIMLLSILLFTSIAGLSTGLQVVSYDEEFNSLRVDIRADCKSGKQQTEYVYLDCAEIIVEKINEDTSEVEEIKTLDFMENKIIFNIPTSIYNTKIFIEEGFFYHIIVNAQGYKEVKEYISYEELTRYTGDEGEPLTQITIEKRLFSNKDKARIKTITFNENIIAKLFNQFPIVQRLLLKQNFFLFFDL
jgi:hypothetical protein